MQNNVRDANLADIVQQARSFQNLQVMTFPAKLSRNADRQCGDSTRMMNDAWVTVLKGQHQTAHRRPLDDRIESARPSAISAKLHQLQKKS